MTRSASTLFSVLRSNEGSSCLHLLFILLTRIYHSLAMVLQHVSAPAGVLHWTVAYLRSCTPYKHSPQSESKARKVINPLQVSFLELAALILTSTERALVKTMRARKQATKADKRDIFGSAMYTRSMYFNNNAVFILFYLNNFAFLWWENVFMFIYHMWHVYTFAFLLLAIIFKWWLCDFT